MKPKLSEFNNAIAPLLPYCRGAWIVAVAKIVNGKHVLLSCRIAADERGDPGNIEYMNRSDEFFAAAVRVPLEDAHIGLMLQRLDGQGMLHLDLPDGRGTVDLLLSPSAAEREGVTGQINWFVQAGQAGPAALHSIASRYRFVLQGAASGWEPSPLSQSEGARLDAFFRGGSPPFERATAFLDRFAPSLAFPTHGSMINATVFEVLIPVPAELSYDPDGECAVLRAPRSLMPQLQGQVFFEPSKTGDHLELLHLPTASSGELETYSAAVTWPSDAQFAEIGLDFGEHRIQSLRRPRRPLSPTLPIAIDEFHDPGRSVLRRELLEPNPTKSRDFEIAVTRLLKLLGVSAIHIGDNVPTRSADILATVLQADGTATVLPVECSVGKPRLKFSALAEQSRRLQERFPNLNVLPVVACPIELEPGEARDAASMGIAVLGRAELKTLLDMIGEQIPEPASVVEYVLSRRESARSAEQFDPFG